MESCKNCGTQLQEMARYCQNCGTKVEIPITYQYVEEDEKEFAFHSEYYRVIGDDYDKSDLFSRISGGVECNFTWYDGVLYELYRKFSDYYILKIKDGSILEVLEIGEFEKYQLKSVYANCHGIFLAGTEFVFVYDFEGNIKCKIAFKEVFGEHYNVSDYYIFGSKLYVALYKKQQDATLSELGMCVRKYDFLTDCLETIWSLSQETEKMEAFAKSQLRGQMEEYGDGDKLHCIEQWLWQISIKPTVYANSQYSVISYFVVAGVYPTDESGYEIDFCPVLLLDFKTGFCEDIKGFKKLNKVNENMRLDLRRNIMWLSKTEEDIRSVNKILGFRIQSWSGIELDCCEDYWQFNTYDDPTFSHGRAYYYFDGEHTYLSHEHSFFAYQKDGSKSVDWNRSLGTILGCRVLGPYVFVADYYEEGAIVKHSIEPPEEKCFDWVKEAVEEILHERETKQIHVTVEEEPETLEEPDTWDDFEEWDDLETLEESETLEEPEVVEETETLEEPEEIYTKQEEDTENIFDSMSILQFRTLFHNTSEYSSQFMTFRKGLKDDKWDFNVVMGILIGSRKRHATGPRHIQEKNAGIGQGDNKDMVVVTLNKYGMMDIYDKYEKISDQNIMVAQAIRDICERTPKLTYICDAIQKILK